MKMRRALTVFLMILMLTPAMVCFMTCCPDKALAADEPVHPCHQQEKKTDPFKPPMLAQDCLKNDLAQVAAIDMPQAQDNGMVILSFLVPVMLAGVRASSRCRYSGTPPPKRRASFHRLLITQRFLQ